MAERDHRSSIDFIFADEDQQFRIGLRSALAKEGYSNIRDCSTISRLLDAFQISTPDLLLIDAGMEEQKAFDIIRDIRHGNLGENPFLTIMVTLREPNANIVKRVIGSGVDDLIVKPVSTADLMLRISSRAAERQPFIVTADYIGPHRKSNLGSGNTEDGAPPNLIEVPNTLGAKTRGEEVDDYELQKLIAEAQSEINEQRLQRNAPEIAALVFEIVPAYVQDRVNDDIRQKVSSLAEFANDVSKRLSNTSFIHVADLCSVLSSISIALQNGQSHERSIALLTPLSNAISVSFNPDPETTKFADEAVRLVREFIDKHHTDFTHL